MLMPASTFPVTASSAAATPDFYGTMMSSQVATHPSITRPINFNFGMVYDEGAKIKGTDLIGGSVDGNTSNYDSGLGAPQQRDTTWTKLFVGGLPYHTTDKSLRDHFKIYGEIEEAVVITDRQTGKSRGYGFVIMSDRASAERACKEPNPIIDGRKANVNLAILGAKPRGNASAAAAIRTGYPTSFLAQQYGLPGTSYVYQPASFGGGPLLSLPSTTASPASQHAAQLAAAIASASASPMSQFYDYQPATLTAASSNAAAGVNAAAFGNQHFAQFATADPYSLPYLTSASGPGVHQHQQHAYAAYLHPQITGSIPAGGGAYAAAVAQDSRMQ